MKGLEGLSRINSARSNQVTWSAALIVLLGVSGFSQSTSPPSPTPSDEPGITREQASQILEELKEIRHLLEKQSRPMAPAPMKTVPQTGKMRVEGGFSIGSADAPLTIVEFTDYECQFCRQFERTTFAELRNKYVDTGKVRFVIRDFPLSIHPSAMRAAEAARCAGDQGKFWPMHDALFNGPAALEVKQLAQYAQDVNLNADQFRTCLESGKHKSDVQNDMQAASALQIMGTPSFLVGKTVNEELSGDILVGAQPLSAFESRLRGIERH